ncbi:hypothetical protein SRHO_G00125100 [Serrasalmus rhombeus]
MRTVSAWILMLSVCEIYAAETVDIYQKQSYVSAKPGEAVTLQCTLADRQSTEDVFWYKQPVGQMPQEVGIKGAFMEAVFSSHFKNSSFKLERVENRVNLTIPHPTKDDEAMYYCGISVMKMIKFSTGTFLAITDHPQLNISVLQTPVRGSHHSALGVMGLALGLFAVWNVILCCFCLKWNICGHFRCNKPHPVTHDLSGTDDLQCQGPDTVELNYAALHFSERNTKKGNKKKKKRGRPQDSVYSEVRSFS